MSTFITSADAVAVLTVDTLYNAGVVLENWAADRAWETEALEMAETQMSVDGYLNAGFVPNPVDQTFHFSANSPSVEVFEFIALSQTTGRTLYSLGLEITIPGLSRKYTFTNGILRTASVIPSAARTLEERTFGLRWQSVTPAGI